MSTTDTIRPHDVDDTVEHPTAPQTVVVARPDDEPVEPSSERPRRTAAVAAGAVVLALALFGGGFATGHAVAGQGPASSPGTTSQGGPTGQTGPGGAGGPMGQDGQLPTPPDGQLAPPSQDGTGTDGLDQAPSGSTTQDEASSSGSSV
ncbi:hypothetical protein [Aeromicrobium sp. REDSEA-S38_B2]|jgi:hypothetical protein|uniref:hypothetical protein n=1 Tax=Aeromicrobium sp. REDSEA-S38_B2 TaxID=1811528 RepID=UPI00257AAB15|nr:hypothetical protein [Aeromicrobium sp. REDSEA-S38_B2]